MLKHRYAWLTPVLLGAVICSSCAKQAPETVVVNQTVTIVRTATLTKAVTTPKLSNVSINLSVTPPNEYAAYSLPIFLTTETMLHLSWKSDGGGFQMKVINSFGEVAGTDMAGVSDTDNDNQLEYIGGFTFSPADFNDPKWSTGFYYFVPQIKKGQGPVKITLSYWTENYSTTTTTTVKASGAAPSPSAK